MRVQTTRGHFASHEYSNGTSRNEEERPLPAPEYFIETARVRDDVNLVIAGEGALRSQIISTVRSTVRAKGLQSSVHVRGFYSYSEMPRVLKSADRWFSTSQSDVQPMIAIEAIAWRLPAIASSDGALDGIVENRVSCLIVNSKAEFVEAASSLLDDKTVYDRMSSKAVKISESFSIERTAEELVQRY